MSYNIGDIVKIVRNHERFWNIITSIECLPTGNVITATVDNHLLSNELSYGNTISFNEDEIVDLYL